MKILNSAISAIFISAYFTRRDLVDLEDLGGDMESEEFFLGRPLLASLF